MKKLALIGASLALAASAHAATVSFDDESAFGPMEIANTLSLGLFDTTLGTLTGITLSLTGAIEGDITLTYGAATGPAQLRGTTDSTIFFSGPASLGLGALLIELAYNTGFQTLDPNSSWTSPTLTDSGALGPIAYGPLAALQAAGGGMFDITCTSISGFGTTGGGGFAGGSQNTFGKCGASITYEYRQPTVVPEPSALALVGLALAGLGLSRRRAAK